MMSPPQQLGYVVLIKQRDNARALIRDTLLITSRLFTSNQGNNVTHIRWQNPASIQIYGFYPYSTSNNFDKAKR
jgi:hypothetical protein